MRFTKKQVQVEKDKAVAKRVRSRKLLTVFWFAVGIIVGACSENLVPWVKQAVDFAVSVAAAKEVP